MTLGELPHDGDRLELLGRRLARLEAVEAVRRVMSEYVLAADARDGYGPDLPRTLSVFARDAVWDGRPRFGFYEGREAIGENLARGGARIDWSLHQVVDAGIEIDEAGETARGRWYLLELARMVNPSAGKPEIVTIGGVYDNTFVREEGVWKLSLMRFDCQAIVGESGVWRQPDAKAEP